MLKKGLKLWPLNNYIKKIAWNYKVVKNIYKAILIYGIS